MSNPVIRQVAPQWSVAAASAHTLTVAPFNIGDLMVAAFYTNGGPATGVSGGGVPSWALATSYYDTAQNAYASLWWGVLTSTGTSTVTVTAPGQGTNYGKIWCREFEAIGANWQVASASPLPGSSGAGPSGHANPVSYPSLTPPAAGNALYVGAAWSYFGNVNFGTGTGFFYANPGSDGPELVAYNPQVSTVTAPTATSTDPTGPWLAVAALFTAGAGTVTSAAYASAFSLIPGTGSWVNPGNAVGVPSGSFATWTAP